MRLIDRRLFMKTAGALFAAGLAPGAAAAFERTDAVFGAACQKADGGFGCAVFSERGEILTMVDLPERGHDITFDPVSRRAVAFARRPLTFAVVFDPATSRTLHTITSIEGRHFFGHGFFSQDGRLLYATENEIATAAGLIGIYDAADGFRRVGEFPTGGMDPHEALLMRDGETIVVANGGLETYPEYGRQKLNIATMEPSLVFLSRRTGALLEKHVLPQSLHQLSIRHLDIDANDRVWFGCQYEGAPQDLPPLAGFAGRGLAPVMTELEGADLTALANYVGSVAASADGRRVAIASPRGNAVLIFDAETGRLAERTTLIEGCGLAAERDGFIATGGKGDVLTIASPEQAWPRQNVLWDNHILALPTLA